MIAINLNKPGLASPILGISLAYLTIVLWFLPSYLNWDMNLYAGLILIPFICRIKRNQLSMRYLLPAGGSLILAICLPVNTTFFIALLFSTLLFVESNFGKLTEAFLFLLFLISPVFKYVFGTVDFSIRLWLTGRVAALLNSMGVHATAVGNQIELEKYSFAVDPICAGLNMLIISLILCLFLIVQYQKWSGRSLNFLWVAALFLFTIVLNICGNFFRIFLLVIFKIMPGTFFHELFGILCLVIYVILPLVLGLKTLVSRQGVPLPQENDQQDLVLVPLRHPLLQFTLIASLIFAGATIVKADTLITVNEHIQLPGFKKNLLKTGISKFENDNLLIYIKPTPFYVPGHDPKICWTGSGYDFKQIRKERIGHSNIYTALLVKGNDKIYAAWWFDNGATSTVDQLEWRWKDATGHHPFYLINVNAMNRKNLKEQVISLLSNQNYLIAKP